MEDITALLALADKMLWVAALAAAPILLSALAVGLAVGLVQAATSVNEQTLTFVPKLAVVAFVLVLMGSSIMTLVGDFAQEVFAQIARMGESEQVAP